MTDAQVAELIDDEGRNKLSEAGVLPQDASADDLRQFIAGVENDFRDKAPLSAAQAATIILEGVSSGAWRILVGDDAKMLDERVRAKPESAYDYQELFGDLIAQAQAAQEA
jgi:hypothetical protein